MTAAAIIKILIEKCGYSAFGAESTANRILDMDKECLEAFSLWNETGEINNLECGRYTVSKLIDEYGLQIPAAFLTISDLKEDYDFMSKILEDGNK